jgi:hypothetical protein
MNKASTWRLDLAQRIAPGYSQNRKAAVVVVAGSVGRGKADRFSDIEIDVYWHEPPTDEDRQWPIERVNGDVKIFWPYSEEEEEWGEEYTVGGVNIGISSFLVSTMDRFVADVVERGDAFVLKQMRLAAIQHAIPLHGEAQAQRWREKAAAYPHALTLAMIRQHLDPEAFAGWHKRRMLAERDDLLMLYDVFCRMEKCLLGALLGLNRIYLANPAFKWLDEMAAEMEIAPVNLSARLKQVFLSTLQAGIAQLESLFSEALSLIEAHVPEVDLTESKNALQHHRPTWHEAPTSLL